MNDVFDEDLIKELGLDPEEFNSPKQKGTTPAHPMPSKKPPTQKQVNPDRDKRTSVDNGTSQDQPSHQAQASLESQFNEKEALQQKPKPMQPPVRSKPDFKPQTEIDEEYGSNLVQEVPVQMAAVLAKKSLMLKDILGLKTGEVIDFSKRPEDPLDLVVNGKLVAKAELVLVDGKLGAKIVKLIK